MTPAKTVMAIAPFRQRLGFAVFLGRTLIHYGVTSLKESKTSEQLFAVIARFVDKNASRFRLDRAVIRDLTTGQSHSDVLIEATNHLKRSFTKRGIEAFLLSSELINRFPRPGKLRSTNRQTVLYLCEKYPELERYSVQKQNWRSDYYMSMFQAIALGLYCVDQQEDGHV